MTQEEIDEKEFEEWWANGRLLEKDIVRWTIWDESKIVWFASRRLLREKESKDG